MFWGYTFLEKTVDFLSANYDVLQTELLLDGLLVCKSVYRQPRYAHWLWLGEIWALLVVIRSTRWCVACLKITIRSQNCHVLQTELLPGYWVLTLCRRDLGSMIGGLWLGRISWRSDRYSKKYQDSPGARSEQNSRCFHTFLKFIGRISTKIHGKSSNVI